MPRPPARRLPPAAARRLLLGRLLAACAAAPLAAACGGRQVVVGTGAPASAASSLEFTNNLQQAVNVYLRGPDGAEVFLRQVPARSTESVPVRGVREGTAVQLRIAPVSGAANITRDNVVIGPGAAVRVP